MIRRLTQTNFSLIRIGMIIVICTAVMTIPIGTVYAGLFQEQVTAKEIIVRGTVRDKSSPLPGVTITLTLPTE